MAQISQIDILSRTLQIIRLMARDEGATVTEISRETGIDRWTVRDMIDRMENFNPDGKGLYIEEFEDERDRRQTRYKVPKENLWTLTLPGMNLSDDEALLLALMFNQGFNSPDIQDSALNLRRKLNMFRNFKEYEVLNLSSARKISTKETQKAIDICEKAGVTYTNIVLDESLLKFSSQFYYIPTTFFVDSEGKMIGDMIIGADLNSYVERLEELLPGWSYEG